MDTNSSEESQTSGIFDALPHWDLLTFLSLAQSCNGNLLEYTPPYNDDDLRRGGNTDIQVVHLAGDLEINQPLPSFAFKRHDLVHSSDEQSQFQKIIRELIIYGNPVVSRHPNIVKLIGISWSVTVSSANSINTPSVVPVLGFSLANRGNLSDYFRVYGSESLTLVEKLKLCIDIGQALEALHSLNMVHGDLKPENILIQQEFGLIARLVDFDGSAVGATDSDRVLIAGTRGWIAPEFNRRDRSASLSEAFKADIYSFGKLCAWILFHGVLNIDEHIVEAGRTSAQRHESFDLNRAVNQAQSTHGNDLLQTVFGPSETVTCLFLTEFFSKTFVGCPIYRSGDIRALMCMLERVMICNDIRRSSGVHKIGLTASLYRHKLLLTPRPYPFSRLHIIQLCLSHIISVKRFLCRSQIKHLSFSEKQWVYRSEFGFRKGFTFAWTLIRVGLLLIPIVFALRVYAELGKDACKIQDGSFKAALCYVGSMEIALFGVQMLVYPLFFSIRFLILYCRRMQRRFALRVRSDESVELTMANVSEIGDQVVRQIDSDRFWRLPEWVSRDDAEPQVKPAARVLQLLMHGGEKCHLLPELDTMIPILSRLHYRVRCRVIEELQQRRSCLVCYQRVDDMLAHCSLLGFGPVGPVRPQLSPETAYQSLKAHLQADLEYKTSLPQLPFELRNRLLDDRTDLFTFNEIPDAIDTIMLELSARFRAKIKSRSSQILCSTAGRLFALIGRHEEAVLCFYVALTHISKPRWRTYDNLSLRLYDYNRSMADHGQMRRTRRRDQLLEAEHDLFLFSLVQQLSILGRHGEAIRELQAIRDIAVAPNGLYLERETGKSVSIIVHRVTDARNLLIRLMLDQDMLGAIEEMRQEYDLADVVTGNGLGHKPTTGQAVQCFITTEQVALMLYRHSQFEDAARMQRRLLSTCTTEKAIQRSDVEIWMVRAALALSLSRSQELIAIEEACRTQTELILCPGTVGEEVLFNVRLNNIYTLTRLEHPEAARLQITTLLSEASKASFPLGHGQETESFNSISSNFWLYEIPDDFRTASVLQRGLLTLCSLIENQDVQLKLLTLLCANPATSAILENLDEITNFVMTIIHESSIPIEQYLICGDRLICLLAYAGLHYEAPAKFEVAQRFVDEIANSVAAIAPSSLNEGSVLCLKNLIMRSKARYLNNVGGLCAGDIIFWAKAISSHRNCLDRNVNDLVSASLPDYVSQLSLITMLIENFLATANPVLVSEAYRLCQEISKYPSPWSFVTETEMAYLKSLITLLDNGYDAAHSDISLQQALTRCESALTHSHPYTNQIRTKLARVLERIGQYHDGSALLLEVVETTEASFGRDHPTSLRARYRHLKWLSSYAAQLELHPYAYLADLSALRCSAARVFGADHVTAQEFLGCYALALERDDRAKDEAVLIKHGVLMNFVDRMGHEHTKTIQEQAELAGMLCRRGGDCHVEGRVHFEMSLRSATNLLGASHPLTQAIWKLCVSAILNPSSSEESAEVLPGPSIAIAASTSTGESSSSNHNHLHGESIQGPTARTALLSQYLLGADHLITIELQKEHHINMNNSSRNDADDLNNQPTDLSLGLMAQYFPIPPPQPLTSAQKQWTMVVEPLLRIFEDQRDVHERQLREALAQGRARFQASGGFRFEYLDSNS